VALTVATTNELAFKGFASEETSPLIKITSSHQKLIERKETIGNGMSHQRHGKETNFGRSSLTMPGMR
jgi:hypothetical protein